MRILPRAVVLVLAIAALASAQSNEEKYQEKLKKEFVSKIAWEQSLEKAMQRAAAEKKPIFGYFSRSYSP